MHWDSVSLFLRVMGARKEPVHMYFAPDNMARISFIGLFFAMNSGVISSQNNLQTV
jgi:hypothetical protein